MGRDCESGGGVGGWGLGNAAIRWGLGGEVRSLVSLPRCRAAARARPAARRVLLPNTSYRMYGCTTPYVGIAHGAQVSSHASQIGVHRDCNDI